MVSSYVVSTLGTSTEVEHVEMEQVKTQVLQVCCITSVPSLEGLGIKDSHLIAFR